MIWHKTSSTDRPKELQRCLCIKKEKRRFSNYYIVTLHYTEIKELNKEYWKDDDLYNFSDFDAWTELKEIENDYAQWEGDNP